MKRSGWNKICCVWLAVLLVLAGCGCGSNDPSQSSEEKQSGSQMETGTEETNGAADMDDADDTADDTADVGAESSDANSGTSAAGTSEEQTAQAGLPLPEPIDWNSMAEVEEFDQMWDAAEAQTYGKVKLETGRKDYTGKGYLTGFEGDGDSCSFQVEVPFDGSFDITVVSAGLGGEKINDISVDGEIVGSFTTPSEEFEESVLKRIYLTKGEHSIGIQKSWGWIALDALGVQTSEKLPGSTFQVESPLINPNASERTVKLMEYLQDIYGSYILSGQFADLGSASPEIIAIKKVTGGKMPAILGLDLMNYSPSFAANGAVGSSVEQAIEYDALGGIVTFCWHWGAPEKYKKEGSAWYRTFYTEHTDIDLTAIMNGEDQEGYELLLQDIDAIAAQLARLQEADVPILFRPLHEAAGGWFWWGAFGPESYIQLWRLLYDRLTNYHGLNNLIWVWNGQAADWYPGDEYVDIIGEDLYPGNHVYTSQSGKFCEAVEYTDPAKIVAMTENGCLFDPDLAFRDQAPWAWFCTWSGEFVVQNGFHVLSEEYTEEYMVNKVYNHERVITLDELPDLKHYAGLKDARTLSGESILK